MIDLEVDRYGYPSDEALDRIQPMLEAVFKAGDGEKFRAAVRECLEAAVEQIPYASGGPVEVDVRGEPKALFAFHTGGWSGCEDFLNHLNPAGLSRFFFLQRWDAGGHWYYDVLPRE